jgi:chromate reductase
MKKYNIGVLVGSLRKESFNKKIARVLMANAPSNLNFEVIEIGDLAHYSEDAEDNVPAAWTAFRGKIKRLDAFLFVTPEYNRSVPSVLKNALDVASRPWGQNLWSGKPAGVVSSSIGAIGGFGANHHLRQSLVFLNVPTMQQPEAYIGNAASLFDDAGQVINEHTKELLTDYMQAYAAWVEKILA